MRRHALQTKFLVKSNQDSKCLGVVRHVCLLWPLLTPFTNLMVGFVVSIGLSLKLQLKAY